MNTYSLQTVKTRDCNQRNILGVLRQPRESKDNERSLEQLSQTDGDIVLFRGHSVNDMSISHSETN